MFYLFGTRGKIPLEVRLIVEGITFPSKTRDYCRYVTFLAATARQQTREACKNLHKPSHFSIMYPSSRFS